MVSNKMPNNDLDTMLQGNNQDISSESQAGTEGTGSNSDNPNEGSGGQPEEVEFNKLSGAAQDRFRQSFRDRQRLQSENEQLKQMAMSATNTQNVPAQATSEQQREALTKLDEVGVATKSFVQQQIQDILARKSFYDDLDKLEDSLDGTDGRPKFVREEYEDYVNRHPQYKGYLPKDVYGIMYEEELLDWRVANRNGNTSTRKTTTLKPTRTSVRGESELTMEAIEEKLASLPEPQRSEWYSANQKKINEVVSKGV